MITWQRFQAIAQTTEVRVEAPAEIVDRRVHIGDVAR
jgi:hypothetical protein